MTLNIQTTRVAINTSGATQNITITDFGFTPSAAMFVWSRTTSADEHPVDGAMSIGFYDGTRSSCMSIMIENAVNPSDTYRVQGDGCCGVLHDGAAVDGRISGNAFISDGVTINLDAFGAGSYYCHVTLFGGTDIASIECDTYDDIGTTSASNIPTPSSFQADTVFCVTVNNNAAITPPTHIAANAIMCFGVWDANDGTQMSVAMSSIDGQSTSQMSNYFDNNNGIVQSKWDSAPDDWVGSFSTHANGFTLTPGTSDNFGNDIIAFLAIEWNTAPSLEIVESTLPSSAADWTESGLSFNPEWGMSVFTNATSEGSNLTTADGLLSISTFESGQLLTAGLSGEDAATGGGKNAASWSKAEFFQGDPGGTTVLSSGALLSLQSGGWTVDTSATHDSRARKGFSMGIRWSAAPAAGTDKMMLLGVS